MKAKSKIVAMSLLSIMMASPTLVSIHAADNNGAKPAVVSSEKTVKHDGYTSYFVGGKEYVKVDPNYNVKDHYPIGEKHPGNCPIVPKNKQTRKDYSGKYEYLYTLKFIDFETGEVVKSVDGVTHNLYLPQVDGGMKPAGYNLDYLTTYTDSKLMADSDVLIFVRKNRFVRLYDKEGNLISSSGVNRFIDWYKNGLPKEFKAPTLSFDGYRLEGNYFVKDFVLDGKVDSNKLKERADKEKARVNSILSDSHLDLNKLNASHDAEVKAKASDMGRKAFDEKVASKDAPKSESTDKMAITYEFYDQDSGNKVGENVYITNKGEKIELKGLPYGYTNQSFKPDGDYYVSEPMTIKVLVKRSLPVSDIISYNDKNAPKQLKTDDELVKAYDLVTGQNSSDEYYKHKFPVYTDEFRSDYRQFTELSKSEQKKVIEDKVASDKASTTYDKRLDGKDADHVNIVAKINKVDIVKEAKLSEVKAAKDNVLEDAKYGYKLNPDNRDLNGDKVTFDAKTSSDLNSPEKAREAIEALNKDRDKKILIIPEKQGEQRGPISNLVDKVVSGITSLFK